MRSCGRFLSDLQSGVVVVCSLGIAVILSSVILGALVRVFAG